MTCSCHNLGRPAKRGEILGLGFGQTLIGGYVFRQSKILTDLGNLFLNIRNVVLMRISCFGRVLPSARIGQSGRRHLKGGSLPHYVVPILSLRLLLSPLNVAAAAFGFNWKNTPDFHLENTPPDGQVSS